MSHESKVRYFAVEDWLYHQQAQTSPPLTESKLRAIHEDAVLRFSIEELVYMLMRMSIPCEKEV